MVTLLVLIRSISILFGRRGIKLYIYFSSASGSWEDVSVSSLEVTDGDLLIFFAEFQSPAHGRYVFCRAFRAPFKRDIVIT